MTPRELADAIGVSESALRRWVDAGRIAMSRTEGGHRRISLQEAVRFIRATGATVVRPELLGLEIPARSTDERVADELFDALKNGDRAVARGLLMSSFLAGTSLPALFDGPLRAALARIGELWLHGPRGILVEHRATAICVDLVAELRSLLPVPGGDAPIALGCAPEGDPYLLPTMLAGAVLAECGFRDINYGPNTPVKLLAQDAEAHGARLVWLAITYAPDPRPIRLALRALASALAARKVDLVVGGRAAGDCAPRMMPGVAFGTSMGDLAAKAVASRARAPRLAGKAARGR